MNGETPEDFERLLEYLKAARGFDFTRYKRSTLFRRVDKRRREVGADTFADYQDFLEVHPGEFAQLFNTILINVTGFFRDEPAWDYLAAELVPKIVGEPSSGEPIRVWSAGCATGEETYTAAMLLAEAMGGDNFRRRVKIYATDVDEDALTAARSAEYPSKALEQVPDTFREKYFQEHGSRFLFRPDLRRSIAFGRHDLVADAPISRISLLICRNTLMYFNTDAQETMLGHLHFALREDGYLFLGRAETLLSHAKLFTPVSLKHRIFARVQGAFPQDRPQLQVAPALAKSDNQQLRDAMMDKVPFAALGVDSEGIVVSTNEQARSQLGLSLRDHGRPLADLEVAYRPAELLPLIDRAYSERNEVTMANVERAVRGGSRYFDIQVSPVFDKLGAALGVVVMFNDVTSFHILRTELVQSRQELETAYEELQSTNEELETTNEELQSTVEELETTNEELQSANEELETINEELQSTNSELETMNEEMGGRTEEVQRANALSESILATFSSGVMVLDEHLRVDRWNKQMEELWGLRSDEAESQLYEKLDIGLPVEKTLSIVRRCLETGERTEVIVDATNRRGKSITVRVVCTPLRVADQPITGIVVAIDEQ